MVNGDGVQYVHVLPTAVWEAIGELIGECDVVCTVPASVGLTLVDVDVSVHRFSVSDGRAMVSGVLLGHDPDTGTVTVPADACTDWRLS